MKTIIIAIVKYVISMRYIRKPIFKLLYKIFPNFTYNYIYKKNLTYWQLYFYFWIDDLYQLKIYFN